MNNKVETIWFFIVFIPMVYLCYRLLMCFDYQKILRRDQVRELKMLMLVVSIGLAYLFAEAFIEVINRFSSFF
jgi:uncharacterized membrane protein YwzB